MAVLLMCMAKTFRGEGVVDGEGVAVKWGGGGGGH